MIEEIKTFEERKEELIKKGKEKGFITYEELANGLKGLEIDSDALDELYNSLIENNIEIVNDESEVGAGGEEDFGGDIEEILKDNPDTCVRIPMVGETRSLNLSNSVAIVLYEALRQNDFSNMKLEGELHRLNWED